MANDSFDWIGGVNFTGQAGQLGYYWTGGEQTIVQADRNGDGVADFEIALAGWMNLTADDFVGVAG